MSLIRHANGKLVRKANGKLSTGGVCVHCCTVLGCCYSTTPAAKSRASWAFTDSAPGSAEPWAAYYWDAWKAGSYDGEPMRASCGMFEGAGPSANDYLDPYGPTSPTFFGYYPGSYPTHPTGTTCNFGLAYHYQGTGYEGKGSALNLWFFMELIPTSHSCCRAQGTDAIVNVRAYTGSWTGSIIDWTTSGAWSFEVYDNKCCKNELGQCLPSPGGLADSCADADDTVCNPLP